MHSAFSASAVHAAQDKSLGNLKWKSITNAKIRHLQELKLADDVIKVVTCDASYLQLNFGAERAGVEPDGAVHVQQASQRAGCAPR